MVYLYLVYAYGMPGKESCYEEGAVGNVLVGDVR